MYSNLVVVVGYALILIVLGGGGFIGLSLLVSGWCDIPLNKAYRTTGVILVIGIVSVLLFFIGYNVVYNLIIN